MRILFFHVFCLQVLWLLDDIARLNVVAAQRFTQETIPISSNSWQASFVMSADLNGDGFLDVLVSSFAGGHIMWYANNGLGSFRVMPAIDMQIVWVKSLAVADLDNDGWPDIVASVKAAGSIRWYRNLGRGLFSNATVIEYDSQDVRDIQVADLNNDGFSDVLSVSYKDDQVAWFANDGHGIFTAMPLISATCVGAFSLSTADLDDDGHQDVLCGGWDSGTVTWYRNNGNGTSFTAMPLIAANSSWRVYVVTSGDLDNDGNVDVLSGSETGEIVWYRNKGSGAFEPGVVIDTVPSSMNGGLKSVFLADTSGSSFLDVLAASWADNSIRLYRNNKAGGFVASQPHISDSVTGAIGVNAGDFNGDGHLDLVAASETDDRIVWFRGDGQEVASEVTPWQTLSTGVTVALCAAVLTSSGSVDIITTLNSHSVVWYRNDGRGHLGTAHNIGTLSQVNDLHASDIDNDGRIDVLAASRDGDRVLWWRNTGQGQFAETSGSHIGAVAGVIHTVVAADFDSDGHVDVVCGAEHSTHALTWFRNQNGSGHFTAMPAVRMITTCTKVVQIVAADLDNDGHVDIAVACRTSHAVLWLRNNGHGTFQEMPSVTTNAQDIRSVAAGDMNGDGHMDLLSASLGDGKVAWYRNEGGGTFTIMPAITSHGTGSSFAETAVFVAVGDMTGDGHLDVVSSSWGDGNIALFQNDGTGSFAFVGYITEPADGTGVGTGYRLALADFHNNGAVDVASANERAGGGVTLYSGASFLRAHTSAAVSIEDWDVDATRLGLAQTGMQWWNRPSDAFTDAVHPQVRHIRITSTSSVPLYRQLTLSALPILSGTDLVVELPHAGLTIECCVSADQSCIFVPPGARVNIRAGLGAFRIIACTQSSYAGHADSVSTNSAAEDTRLFLRRAALEILAWVSVRAVYCVDRMGRYVPCSTSTPARPRHALQRLLLLPGTRLGLIGAPTPAAEGVDKAADGTTSKMLVKQNTDAGFSAQLLQPTIVKEIRIYTANDGPERDPASYLLQAQKYSSSSQPWVNVSLGDVSLPLERNTEGQPLDLASHYHVSIALTNAEPYASYKLTFPTIRSPTEAYTQVAEVVLLGYTLLSELQSTGHNTMARSAYMNVQDDQTPLVVVSTTEAIALSHAAILLGPGAQPVFTRIYLPHPIPLVSVTNWHTSVAVVVAEQDPQSANTMLVLERWLINNCSTTADAQDVAGALKLLNAHVSLANSTLQHNTAVAGHGGAVALYGSTAQLHMKDVEVLHNTATEGCGGGVYVAPSSVFEANGTSFLGNRATGGGAVCAEGVATLSDSVFMHNQAGGVGDTGDDEVAASGTSQGDAVYQGAGGGVYGGFRSTTSLVRTWFSHNTATSSGGAVFSFSDLSVRGCSLEHHSAVIGGAVACDSCRLWLDNCTMAHNVAVFGGALYGAAARMTGQDIHMLHNSAGHGGACYCRGPSSSVPLLLSISVGSLEGNRAGQGGAVWASNCGMMMSRVSILDNEASTSVPTATKVFSSRVTASTSQQGGLGGAVFATGLISVGSNFSLLQCRNSSMASNQAAIHGGAIAVYGQGEVELKTCSVHHNTAGGRGGGVFFGSRAPRVDEGSSVENNSANNDPAAANVAGAPASLRYVTAPWGLPQASGRAPASALLLELVDSLGQLVGYDNSSTVLLRSSGSPFCITGTPPVQASMGTLRVGAFEFRLWGQPSRICDFEWTVDVQRWLPASVDLPALSLPPTALRVTFAACTRGQLWVAGSSFCADCSAGEFSNATEHDTQHCYACRAGEYSEATGQSACRSCDRGAYSPTDGLTRCFDCQPGRYASSAAASRCRLCPAGRQGDSSGASACSACAAGMFSSFNGSASCVECPSGRYTDRDGASSCVVCATGRFARNTSSTVCDLCPPGTAVALQGAVACEACQRGQYSDEEGSIRCRDCPLHFEAPTFGSMKCTECPHMHYTDTPGAMVCRSCSAGFYSVTAPSVTTLQPNRTVATHVRCDPCPTGLVCESRGIVFAQAGYQMVQLGDGRLTSQACLPGMCLRGNASSQGLCAPGRKPPPNPLCGACIQHPPHSQWGQQCVSCEEGTRWTTIVLLLVGTLVFVLGFSRVSLVATGGMRVAVYYLQMSLIFIDASAYAHWLAVLNLDVLATTGDSTCIFSVSQHNRMWMGVLFPALSFVYLGLIALLHYGWSKRACCWCCCGSAGAGTGVGADAGAGSTHEPAYYMRRRVSLSMAQQQRQVLGLGRMETVTAAATLDKDDTDTVTELEMSRLSHQHYALTNATAHTNANTDADTSISVVGTQVLEQIHADHLLPWEAREQGIMTSSPPLFSPVFDPLVYGRIAISLYVFSYNTITRTVFEYLDCVEDISTGKRYVRTYAAVDCDSQQWQRLFLPAILLLTLYVLIVPLFLLLKLTWASRKNTLRSSTMRRLYGGLYEPFHTNAFFWGSLTQARRLVLVAVWVFLAEEPDTRIGVASLLNIVFLVLQVWRQPYGWAEDNAFEVLSLVGLTATTVSLTMTSTPFTPTQDILICALVMGVGCVLLLRTLKDKAWRMLRRCCRHRWPTRTAQSHAKTSAVRACPETIQGSSSTSTALRGLSVIDTQVNQSHLTQVDHVRNIRETGRTQDMSAQEQQQELEQELDQGLLNSPVHSDGGIRADVFTPNGRKADTVAIVSVRER